MRVLVVSGIWPPDVGGPASHAPDVAAYLRSRGHEVEVVTTAAAAPAPALEKYPVHWISRSLPKGVIHARTAAEIARRARWADVVYTTGMFGRSASGATMARRPYVVKLTADPAFERARRRGMVGGDVDEFQRAGGDAAIRTLRVARDAELRHAAHVFTPSAYLRELAVSWGVPAERVSVLPNPTPPLPALRPRDEIRAELGLTGPVLAFAGRLTAQKSLGVALEAVAANDGVTLLIAGEGDERAPLERRAGELGLGDRVRFLGAQPRDSVLELFRAADASILSSSWENFPHTVVEALAVGTPVLATATGGVAEVVRDGENGLLVASGDAAALAGAVRRFFADEALRERLRAAAAPSVAEYAPELVFARLEAALLRAARRLVTTLARVTRPRVLFVSRTRYRLPPSPTVAAKFGALREQFDVRVLASAAPGSLTNDETFSLVPPLRPRRLDGIAFWLGLPWRAAAMLRHFRPQAVVCQTPYDGAAALLARRVARVPARVIVEVHGDWRTSTRLYGSSARRVLGRLGDAVAAAALRRADAVRTVSPFTAGLVREFGVEPAADFPAYMDLEPFVVPPQPLPERPVALFVGVLEAYKNVDGLAAAWRLAAQRVPVASLHVVGKGTRTDVAEALVRDCGAHWDRELATEEVAAAMDAAWVLVLPSRSEGMGRVLVEAFCRGRGVVGTRAGSIPDLVTDEESGLLVVPDDPAALADALVRVLSDRTLAERIGDGARDAAAPWLQTPDEYARRMRELVA